MRDSGPGQGGDSGEAGCSLLLLQGWGTAAGSWASGLEKEAARLRAEAASLPLHQTVTLFLALSPGFLGVDVDFLPGPGGGDVPNYKAAWEGQSLVTPGVWETPLYEEAQGTSGVPRLRPAGSTEIPMGPEPAPALLSRRAREARPPESSLSWLGSAL